MKFIGQLLGEHLGRYPAMQVADVYKLLHQAALGSAHAVDAANARELLRKEAAGLTPAPESLLAEVISPDGRLARVHLAACLGRGLPLDALADAFSGTAATYTGSPDKLAKFCGCLGDFADAGGIPFTRAEVESFMGARQREGWPAVHHSDAYRAAHTPAYRVVDVTLLPQLGITPPPPK
jgi:hypothetical protein